MPSYYWAVTLVTGRGILQRANELVKQQCGTIIRSSSLYETAAWGKTDQPAFLTRRSK